MSEDSNAAAAPAKEEKTEATPQVVKPDATVEASNAAATAGEARPETVPEVGKGGVKDEPVTTVRQMFSLPENETDRVDDRWKAFQERLSQEVKGVKWTAAMPDLAPKVCELLDIKIPDILVGAWKKVSDLQTVLEESKKTPEKVVYLDLAEHTINSEHKPSIDVKIRSATVKKLQIVIQLAFKLKGFVLKIQDGLIKEIETGQCEAKGTIKYGDLTIAEKKVEPIKLPLTIPIADLVPKPIQEIEKAEDQGNELERIEL